MNTAACLPTTKLLPQPQHPCHKTKQNKTAEQDVSTCAYVSSDKARCEASSLLIQAPDRCHKKVSHRYVSERGKAELLWLHRQIHTRTVHTALVVFSCLAELGCSMYMPCSLLCPASTAFVSEMGKPTMMMMIGFVDCEHVADRLEGVGSCKRLDCIGLDWKTGVVFEFQVCRCTSLLHSSK